MLLCIAGDAHGRLDRMYSDVLAFEGEFGLRFDAVLHLGDFGIWPNAGGLDRATREHEGAGDFPTWLNEKRSAPLPTYFIKGNHEDFDWLEQQSSPEILPNLTYLRSAQTLDIGGIIVVGIGGCFGPSNYDRPSQDLRGIAHRHFTRDEVEKVCKQSGIESCCSTMLRVESRSSSRTPASASGATRVTLRFSTSNQRFASSDITMFASTLMSTGCDASASTP